jgi:ribose transport system substrate-binding protein
MHKTSALRILNALVDGNLLTRVGQNKYKLAIRPLGKRRYRIGYGMQSNEFSFSRAIAASLQRSATLADIEILVLDNQDSPRTALHNAEIFGRERIDLVIESQTDARIASEISRLFSAASIPVIALEIPHPQTVFYGANNSQAGLMAGRHLTRWAEAHWNGEADELLLLELPKAGRIPNARLLGSMLGVFERMVWLSQKQVKVLPTSGHLDSALAYTRQYLRRTRATKILVAAINDPCALGALQAFREVGREDHCCIVGHNASSEAHSELSNRGSRFIGSVGYFPERYGDGVIPLAMGILARRPTPRATFVKHETVTPANLRSFLPT